MSIASRINEMTEHLRNGWGSIDKLGLDITEENSNDNLDKNIENIAPVLDRFYNQVSDKIDLSENGIVGRTSQDGDPTPENPVEINNLSGDVEYKVRGKNKLNTSTIGIGTKNGVTCSYNNKTQEITFNGTCTTNNTVFSISNNSIPFTINTTTICAYLTSEGNNTGNGLFRVFADNYSTYDYLNLTTLTSTNRMISKTTSATITKTIFDFRFDNGAVLNNFTIKLMITDSEDTTYEPYISQTFDIPLKSRNLFDKDNINVISAYISGSRVIASATVDKLIYIPCKPNTTYSLQKMPQETTNYNRFRIGTTTDTPALRMTVEDYFNAGDGSTLTNKTITTGANANYLVFYCYREDTLTSFEDMMSSIQIEEGLTATTYEPYYDIELCNISDYKDRIYSQNGEFYLEKKTGKVVFDGSESWTINTSYTYNVFYRTLDNYARISNAQTTYCEYYKGIENAGGIANFGNNYNNSIGVRTANDNIKDIYISNNSITSASDFKTWLSTHNTVVYYVLATPTTTEITDENYPTLYSQLLAIQQFLTKYKINKEFLLDYSNLEIEY